MVWKLFKFFSVNPNSMSILLANCVSIFSANDTPIFNKVPRNLPRNPPDWTILGIFYGFTSADKLFAKVLQRFENYLYVKNSLRGKSAFSFVPIKFSDNLGVNFFSNLCLGTEGSNVKKEYEIQLDLEIHLFQILCY